MESTSATWNISSMFGRLRLLGDEPKPATTPPRPPAPLRPTITYDKGLLSLPDDILCEIFGLLDLRSLKFCSLTGKVLSCSVKPFIHRALYLTPRSNVPTRPRSPGPWDELQGLPVLSERGLLQHTRHISISLPRNPLFVHDLKPHFEQLRTVTNLRSLKTRWLDVPSFIPKMKECFGAFLGTLQSLELESPRGDHQQLLYFACRFPNLRDLKVNGLQDYSHSMRNGGPHFEIKSSPPLDGTLDLWMNMNPGSTWSDLKGPQLFLSNLLTLPSGLKFRTLKLSGCTGNNLQLLIEACAPTLECMELTSEWFDAPQCPQLNFKRHSKLQNLVIKPAERANIEKAVGWLSETLSTIRSDVFTKLTISTAIFASFPYPAGEGYVRGWHSVDNVLDRLSLCEDVTLVVRPGAWVERVKFEKVIDECFPLMRENGRVVLEVPAPPPPLARDMNLEYFYSRRLGETF